MAPLPATEFQVTLSLEKGEDSLNDRSITFKSSGGSIQIGRASKTERKRLIPAADNMWISNPVISRYHAVLSVAGGELDDARNPNTSHGPSTNDVQTPLVFLEDTTSSHGTFVNKADIKGCGRRQIVNGDKVQFGDKVLRGADAFDPPVFRVQIKHVASELIPQSSSTGRSISVPDDVSDDSEMDESHSDIESMDSRSSPPKWGEDKLTETSTVPGSLSNPFMVNDESGNRPEVIDLTSREASEEYEPSPNLHAVQDAYTQEHPEERGYDIGEPLYDDIDADEPVSERDDNPHDLPQSPIYAPTSPEWNPLRHEEFVSQHSVQLPPMEIPVMPLVQHTAGPNVYYDGPFAQPEVYSGSDIVDSGTSQAEERVSWPPSLTAFSCPTAQPDKHNNFSVTVSTQDLLDSARTTTSKNDMSIKSIINHTAAAGKKRKADDISEDLPKAGVETEAVMESVSVAGAVRSQVEAMTQEQVEEDVVQSAEPVLPVAVEKRPAKRLRTMASHIGAFAFGGVAVLAGLMSLPDNYFG